MIQSSNCSCPDNTSSRLVSTSPPPAACFWMPMPRWEEDVPVVCLASDHRLPDRKSALPCSVRATKSHSSWSQVSLTLLCLCHQEAPDLDRKSASPSPGFHRLHLGLVQLLYTTSWTLSPRVTVVSSVCFMFQRLFHPHTKAYSGLTTWVGSDLISCAASRLKTARGISEVLPYFPIRLKRSHSLDTVNLVTHCEICVTLWGPLLHINTCHGARVKLTASVLTRADSHTVSAQ